MPQCIKSEQLSDMYKKMNKSCDWLAAKMEIYCLFNTVVIIMMFLIEQ